MTRNFTSLAAGHALLAAGLIERGSIVIVRFRKNARAETQNFACRPRRVVVDDRESYRCRTDIEAENTLHAVQLR